MQCLLPDLLPLFHLLIVSLTLLLAAAELIKLIAWRWVDPTTLTSSIDKISSPLRNLPSLCAALFATILPTAIYEENARF